jgi:uncharacterized membrane protein
MTTSTTPGRPAWIIAGWGWVATALAFATAPVAVRAPVIFGFAMVGPGLALVGFLRRLDALERLVLAVGVSVSLSALIAEAMALAGHWNAGAGIAALALIATGAAALQARRHQRGDHRGALVGQGEHSPLEGL